MEIPKYIDNTIFIQASSDRVWELLTSPTETKKYMFGCETVSDWKVGSKLDWEMLYEGQLMVAVTGKIKAIEPGKSLIYSVFDPNSKMADIPANYLTVSYHLTAENGGTRLDVRQGDYSTVAEGKRRYNEAYNNGEGWNPILVQIKAIAETEQ